jgi:hypothetical protein
MREPRCGTVSSELHRKSLKPQGLSEVESEVNSVLDLNDYFVPLLLQLEGSDTTSARPTFTGYQRNRNPTLAQRPKRWFLVLLKPTELCMRTVR